MSTTDEQIYAKKQCLIEGNRQPLLSKDTGSCVYVRDKLVKLDHSNFVCYKKLYHFIYNIEFQ